MTLGIRQELVYVQLLVLLDRSVGHMPLIPLFQHTFCKALNPDHIVKRKEN